MGIGEWLAQNWFNLFGSAGVAGLWLAVVALREETKARRDANLLTITANHCEVWKEYLHNPDLKRVRDAAADTAKEPATETERVFVALVFLHLSSVHHTMNDQLVIKLEGLRRDVAQFLALPIPNEIWEKIKPVQNDEFIAFVESCRNWK